MAEVALPRQTSRDIRGKNDNMEAESMRIVWIGLFIVDSQCPVGRFRRSYLNHDEQGYSGGSAARPCAAPSRTRLDVGHEPDRETPAEVSAHSVRHTLTLRG